MDILKKKSKKNIVIIGLMGSGKSIVGRRISGLLGFDHLDTDKVIEKKEDKTINKIFLENGENYFREIEEKYVLEMLDCKNTILSLGGGSIINKKIRDKIIKNSISIYLKVDIDLLVKRLEKSYKRPLLNDVDIHKKLLEIYENRKKFYEKADIIVKNNFNVSDVCKNICLELEINSEEPL